VDRIIKDYIPTLPAGLTPNRNNIKAPPSLLETLKNAVAARNSAVHAGSKAPDPDFVDRVLAAVSDMLHIFDYYAGNTWALNLLSGETRAAITSEDS
jgi:hypothetical protein